MRLNAYAAASNMIEEEDKSKILLRVFQGIIDKCDIIKNAIEQRDYEKKYIELSKVTMIIQILDSSLDKTQGEVPEKLSSLYDYILKRFMQIHSNLDVNIVMECRTILSHLMEGFEQASEIERKKNFQHVKPMTDML